MRDVWIISDTHFHHKNILGFEDKDGKKFRGDLFSSVEEMDEYMVDRWNSVVKDCDIVYHLGDVMLGPKDKFKELWPRLKGSKRLVVGNHDDVKFMVQGGFFKKVSMWRMFPDHGLLFTHVPIHESGLERHGKMMINVHGHIHQNESPTEHHFNASVENIQYTPVHIDDIRAW